MRSVAIVGANSFLAKKLANEFIDTCKLFLYSRTKNNVYNKSCEFIEFNYPEVSLDLNRLLGFDVIIYTAAAGVQANKQELPINVYDINFYLPLQLLTHLNKNDYKGKVFTFGSYFEIGNNTSLTPFNENEVILSTGKIPNIYCDSKRLLSRLYSNGQFKINWFHLIIPSLYGYGEDSNRLIPYVVNSLLSNTELKTSSGEQIRQYLYVNDLTHLIKILIEKDVKPDVYNVIGNNVPIKIKDVVMLIHTLLGKKYVPAENINTRDQGMLVLSLNGSKLTYAVPEWESATNMNEGIKSYF